MACKAERLTRSLRGLRLQATTVDLSRPDGLHY
jgi:hypothetical protein